MKLEAVVRICGLPLNVSTREHMTIEAALEEMARALSKIPDEKTEHFVHAYMPKRAGVNKPK